MPGVMLRVKEEICQYLYQLNFAVNKFTFQPPSRIDCLLIVRPFTIFYQHYMSQFKISTFRNLRWKQLQDLEAQSDLAQLQEEQEELILAD